MNIQSEKNEIINVARLRNTKRFTEMYKRAHKRTLSRSRISRMCLDERLPHIQIDGFTFIILGEKGEVPQIAKAPRKAYVKRGTGKIAKAKEKAGKSKPKKTVAKKKSSGFKAIT